MGVKRSAEGVYLLENTNGVEMCVLGFGGIIQSLRTPDRHGAMADVVLGFDDPDRYRGEHPYLGALIGRYAGRIPGGRILVEGREHVLSINRGTDHLHGGHDGFDRVTWSAESFRGDDHAGLILRHTSPAGEEGYPGTLCATVTYTLTDADELVVDYLWIADAPTPVNLTQHSYFNLAGHASGDVRGHEVMIDADAFALRDPAGIPTGGVHGVDDTPLDFRAPHAIGARIDQPHPQLRDTDGYDHIFILNDSGPALRRAAHVREPRSGRVLEVFTTSPCLVFYTANHFDGTLSGKGGAVYGRQSAFAMETQRFPHSPKPSLFPSVISAPGQEYRSRTLYRFSVDD